MSLTVKKLTLVLLALLLAAGCGGSEDALLNPLPPGDQQSEFALDGVWGGHFPGSSLENPRAGVEVHFFRANNNAFIHRVDPYSATRSTVQVHRDGGEVTLHFPTVHGDDSTFRGSFVDQHTLRGRFSNSSRGEDFPMEFVSAVSVFPPAELTPAQVPGILSSQALPVRPQGENLSGTLLVIDAYDDQGAGYEFGFGLGYYYSPGDGQVWGTLPPGADPAYLNENIVAPTAVIQMAFYPEWISFDVYTDVNQLEYMATFEVRLADFARINPGDPNSATDIEVYKSSQVGVFPDDVSVAKCRMRYISFSDLNNSRFGNFPLGTDGEVSIDETSFRVPRAVAAMLAGFRGVDRMPDPPSIDPPVAKIEYINLDPVNKIRFDSSGSQDPSGGPLTYSWDFGDGATSTEASPIHTFEPGVHKVTLTVTTNQGATATTSVTVGF